MPPPPDPLWVGIGWPTTSYRCGHFFLQLALVLALLGSACPFETLDVDNTFEEEVYSENLDAVKAPPVEIERIQQAESCVATPPMTEVCSPVRHAGQLRVNRSRQVVFLTCLFPRKPHLQPPPTDSQAADLS